MGPCSHTNPLCETLLCTLLEAHQDHQVVKERSPGVSAGSLKHSTLILVQSLGSPWTVWASGMMVIKIHLTLLRISLYCVPAILLC